MATRVRVAYVGDLQGLSCFACKDSSAVGDEQRLVWFLKCYVPPSFLRNFGRG